MTIGARVFKTGLGVALALWVGALVGLESPLIAAIAAIFTIQPSIYRSWMQVLEQLQSNVLGAVAAIAAVSAVGNNPIVVGIVCIGMILLCIKLKTEETIGLTLVTVVVIMEAHGQGWMVALERVAALLTGIVCAFAVNVAIAPPRHRVRFIRQAQETEAILFRLLRTAVSNELRENVFRDELDHLQARVRKLEEFYRLFAEERVWRRQSRADRARLLVVYKEIVAVLERGIGLIEAVENHYFAVPGREAWSGLIDGRIEALCGYHEQLLWKLEGKLKPGAAAAAPSPDTSTMLADTIVERMEGDAAGRTRLLVVASALYEYEMRLRRLDKRLDHYKQRSDDSAETEAV